MSPPKAHRNKSCAMSKRSEKNEVPVDAVNRNIITSCNWQILGQPRKRKPSQKCPQKVVKHRSYVQNRCKRHIRTCLGHVCLFGCRFRLGTLSNASFSIVRTGGDAVATGTWITQAPTAQHVLSATRGGVGHNMGGAKRMKGGTRTRIRIPWRHFWTPPKATGLLDLEFLKKKDCLKKKKRKKKKQGNNTQSEWKTYQTKGGRNVPQNRARTGNRNCWNR